MNIKRGTKIILSDRITERDLGDEIIVMKHMDTEHHVFRDTAKVIWKLIHEDVTADEMHAFVVDEYKIDEKEAWNDLVEFLAELRDKGLVRF